MRDDTKRVWPLLRTLAAVAEEQWRGAAPNNQTPTDASYVIAAHDLEQRLRNRDVLEFPGNRLEYFLLPPLPEEDFVGYLAFEWRHRTEVEGSYHVYLVHKNAIAQSRRGELGKAIAAYVVRYETANETHYQFSHAQGCSDKKPTHYPGFIDYLPRTIVPKSLPHLPLRTCRTPVGFLLTLVAGLYGTESDPFKRLSQEEGLSAEEFELVRELRSGIQTKPPAAT